MGVGEEMRTDDVKQGTKFKLIKKIGAWALVPGLGVPITKLVESHYDVSFISRLWSWMSSVGDLLAQSFIVQLWMMIAMMGCVLLLAAVGFWAIMDANSALDAADSELEAVNSKLEAANIDLRNANLELRANDAKLKAANSELDAAKLELDVTDGKLKAASLGLDAAFAKIDDLKTPKVQPLTEDQRVVLACIVYYDNSQERCYVKALSERLEFTMVQTEGAVDVLVKRKLVVEYRTSYGNRVVSLSQDGRAYVLQPDFDMSYLPV